jgi:hypothetical protein
MDEAKQTMEYYEGVVYKEILKLRSLHRIIEDLNFKNLVIQSNNKQQAYVYVCILCRDVDKLKDWIKNQPKEIEDLPIRDLRNLARKMQIKNYSRKTKYQIAKEIRNKGIENGKRFVSGDIE